MRGSASARTTSSSRFRLSRQGLAHHSLAAHAEQIEEHESHVSTPALALREDCLNPLVAVAGTRFTVKDS
jgi:hypothetical protein